MQVLIAEDHVAVTMIASQMARKVFEEPAVRVAQNADALFEQLNQLPADLLVLDLTMPGTLKRIQLLRAVHALPQAPRVLVYSADASPCLVEAALENGATGFVPKGAAISSLAAGMQAVAKGERYVDAGIKGLEQAHPWRQLTAAEREVLVALVAGRAAKQIAADSGRAYNTVATLRAHGLRKLGLRTNEALAAYFRQHGLLFELDAPFTPDAGKEAAPEPRFPSASNVVELRPKHLPESDLETIDVISLVLLGIEDGRRRMEVTPRSLAELIKANGSPKATASHAFRFPAIRWTRGDYQWLAIDQGRVRVTIQVPLPARASS